MKTLSSEAIHFQPYNPLNNTQCSLCSTNSENREWVFHDATTNKLDEFAQHYFHKECLREYCKKTFPNCPTCKKLIDLTSIFTLDEEKKILNDILRKKIQLNANIASKLGILFLVGISHFWGKEYIWAKASISAFTYGLFGYSLGNSFFPPIRLITASNAAFIGAIASLLCSYDPLLSYLPGNVNVPYSKEIFYSTIVFFATYFYLPVSAEYSPPKNGQEFGEIKLRILV